MGPWLQRQGEKVALQNVHKWSLHLIVEPSIISKDSTIKHESHDYLLYNLREMLYRCMTIKTEYKWLHLGIGIHTGGVRVGLSLYPSLLR